MSEQLRSKELGVGDDDGSLNVIIFLENNMYGYGFTYDASGNELPYQSNNYEDCFTLDEITNDNFEGMLGIQNRLCYVEEHENCQEALDHILDFWNDTRKGVMNRTLNFKTAVEHGRRENLNFIVF